MASKNKNNTNFEKLSIPYENQIAEDENMQNENTESENIQNEYVESESQIIENENTESSNTEDIPESIKGYKVIAKLEIPKIDLITYVLSETNDNSLNISVTKFWGSEPNEVGNFCIAGHNFKRNNMFINLKKLSINDEIYLTDMKERKVGYKVYDILTVNPYDTACVSQNTEGRREITLITCTATSVSRLIIKAKEI